MKSRSTPLTIGRPDRGAPPVSDTGVDRFLAAERERERIAAEQQIPEAERRTAKLRDAEARAHEQHIATCVQRQILALCAVPANYAPVPHRGRPRKRCQMIAGKWIEWTEQGPGGAPSRGYDPHALDAAAAEYERLESEASREQRLLGHLLAQPGSTTRNPPAPIEWTERRQSIERDIASMELLPDSANSEHAEHVLSALRRELRAVARVLDLQAQGQ
jgi:hypothetical protein